MIPPTYLIDLEASRRHYSNLMSAGKMSPSRKPQLNHSWIDSRAVEIIRALQNANHVAYLVGGCVRDLLAGVHPKDFDIATSADPREVKRAVKNAYIIGKRFRLVLVKRGVDQFEVATFRRDPKPDEQEDEAHPEADNVFGTPEEDAKRRDFTVNGLFFDPISNDLIDYNNGMDDIESRMIRMIGDPVERLKEDPIRILRALRLAHKLTFSIEPELRRAMVTCSETLPSSALPRRREELLKILRLKDPGITLHEAHDLGLLKSIFPALDSLFLSTDSTEIFQAYMLRLKEFVEDESDPLDLFSFLTYATLVSLHKFDPQDIVQPGHYSKQEDINEFMKNEFGMFTAEIAEVTLALEIIPRLQDIDYFERKGARRKTAFLNQNGFALALKIAEFDHLLGPTELHYWTKAFQERVEKPKPKRQYKKKKSTRKRSTKR